MPTALRPIGRSLPLIGLMGLGLLVAACTSSSSGGTPSSATPPVSASPSTASSGTSPSSAPVSSTPASSTPPPATVSIALGWTPNTDFTGVYVAESLGYYKAQNITVKIIPYATTAPETLVSHGKANFAFSYQAGLSYARAAGQDIISVLAPDQKGTYVIGVRADDASIKTPKDLDGKTYAGFGSPDELPELKYVIQHAGGKGVFKDVTLNTSAYDAVYSGKADFTIPIVTWEAIQAKLVGKPLKTFAFTDYGFPDQYSDLIVSSSKYLNANPDVAKRFLAATVQGYAYAADHPKAAAQLVIDDNSKFLTNHTLVIDSEELLASGGYLKNAKGQVGTQDPAIWQKYGHFLFSNGLLTDAKGKKVTTEPDWSTYWTNSYLPAADQ